MTFKKIQFKDAEAQKIYENYLATIQTATRRLSKEDQNDILMELNSHIFESVMKHLAEENELIILKETIENIGNPKEILKPLIAEKKLNQATRTFNPIHIFTALVLNFSFGIVYFIFFILYFILFTFPVLVVLKLIYPENVGCFYKKGEFFAYAGHFPLPHEYHEFEILGNWFIPVNIILGIIYFFIVTMLLKSFRYLWKRRQILHI